MSWLAGTRRSQSYGGNQMYWVLLIAGILFCLLAALGQPVIGPVQTFPLGVGLGFASLGAHHHYHPHA